jgi:hypothetical protein
MKEKEKEKDSTGSASGRVISLAFALNLNPSSEVPTYVPKIRSAARTKGGRAEHPLACIDAMAPVGDEEKVWKGYET